MKIAVVADLLRPNGAGIMAIRQAQLLASVADVTLFGAAAPLSLSAASTATVRVERFSSVEGIFDVGINAERDLVLVNQARSWLVESLRHFQPDVVMVHNCGRFLNQAHLSQLASTYPTAHIMHDEWFYTDSHYVIESDDDRQPVQFSFEPLTNSDPRAHDFSALWGSAQSGGIELVSPSKWLAQRASQVFPNLNLTVIPNPVLEEEFPPLSRAAARRKLGIEIDGPIVGFVGDPTAWRKNYELLQRAANLLSPDELSAVLVVGGAETSIGAGIRSRVSPDTPVSNLLDSAGPDAHRRHKFGERHLHLSGMRRDHVATAISAMDLVVHPSRADNLPTVPIESAIAGRRCLATDVGGTSETVVDGCLCRSDVSAEGLSSLIRRELTVALAETETVQTARRTTAIRQFGAEPYITRITDLIDAMVARKQA